MAGKKHHHVPQLLQRRFGHKGRKSTQVVVYNCKKEPFQTSTANYGAEGDFYADGDNFFVDDLITDFENDIQSFVMRLVEGDAIALNDKVTISALISHLEMRSIFLRKRLFDLSGMMVDYFENIFCDRRNLVKVLCDYIKENPEFLRDGLKENLGVSAPIVALEEFISPHIKPYIIRQSAAMAEIFADIFIEMRGTLQNAVKPSHLEALTAHPSGVNRAKFYADFNFTIQKAPVGSFILPDTMVAFCTAKKVTPFTQKGDELVELFLPLASDVMLVGTAKKGWERSVSELNSMLASIAFESFIGLHDKPDFRALVKKIGKNAQIISPSDSERLLRGILRDKLGKG